MIYCARKFSELLLPGGHTTLSRESSLDVSLYKNTIPDLSTSMNQLTSLNADGHQGTKPAGPVRPWRPP